MQELTVSPPNGISRNMNQGSVYLHRTRTPGPSSMGGERRFSADERVTVHTAPLHHMFLKIRQPGTLISRLPENFLFATVSTVFRGFFPKRGLIFRQKHTYMISPVYSGAV